MPPAVVRSGISAARVVRRAQVEWEDRSPVRGEETTVTFGAQGYALANGEGEQLWFLKGLMTVKAGGLETRNAFTVIEAECPAGSGPPPHIHHDEEEAFYLLEGELAITCGEQTWTASPGAFALLPRGIPHSFRASDAGNARMLQISSPAQFERFAAEIGEPAKTKSIPSSSDVDLDNLKRVARKYGIEMLAPPPA
jgi:quercetin dioxygenase-like cupin family protein